MSGGAGLGGLGQALGGIGNAFDGVFDPQAQANQLQWAASAQEAAHARLMADAQRQGFMPDSKAVMPRPPAQKATTFREQLQHETDDWLKGIEL